MLYFNTNVGATLARAKMEILVQSRWYPETLAERLVAARDKTPA